MPAAQTNLRRISFGIISLILLAEFLIIVGMLNIFGIKHIVTGSYYSPLFLNQGGKNIFNFNTDILEEKIQTENPKIKNVTINKQIPNTLFLDYENRSPFIIVTDRLEENFFYADKNGVIYDTADNSNYPLLKTERISLKTGVDLNRQEEKLSLKLINALLSTNIDPKKISIVDEIIIINTDSTEIISGSDINSIDKVEALQLLLKRYTIEGKIPQKIDLRFDKPVVTNG